LTSSGIAQQEIPPSICDQAFSLFYLTVKIKKAGTRPAHREIPQTLPVLQAGELEKAPPGLPPATREAKVETFFLTCWPPQVGQTTSLVALALRTSSSKGRPHSWQMNSYIGIFFTSIGIDHSFVDSMQKG
jgi:hypothetical protein